MNSYRPAYRDRERDRSSRSPPYDRGLNQAKPPRRTGHASARRSASPRAPPPSQYDSYRPKDPPGGGGGPRPPQGAFTFRFEKPAGIGDLPARPSPRRDYNPNDYYKNKIRHKQGFGRPRPAPSNRPMLALASASLPKETVFGVDESRSKYRAVEDLSDEDEVEMDMSDDDDDGDVGDKGPTAKKARTGDPAPAGDGGDAAPKWSNPDPYVVLPPVEDAQRKKVDVVKLIRKARFDFQQTKAALGTVEDFISFDTDDSGSKARVEDRAPPIGKRTSTAAAPSLPPKPDRIVPPFPSIDPQQSSLSRPLGSYKRTFDDKLKPTATPGKMGPKGKNAKTPSDGNILFDWLPEPNRDPCPWNLTDHSMMTQPSTWLHREIVDFYDWVRPREFEQRIRTELVADLQKLLRGTSAWRDVKVMPFGSFVSGLYLPTGDMDLVLCSWQFLKDGFSSMRTRKTLYRFKDFLVRSGVAKEDGIEIIGSAKVPLVKYVDSRTQLRVDVSFDNTNGVDACRTFLAWKERYPAMPALVTLVKHFLLMRGLSEPVSGGIGGLSVICLVVSMLQLMPQAQSASMKPEHHLGEMFIEFLRLYGRDFDHEALAIRLNPPGYVEKSLVEEFMYKDPKRLSIIDPNNPANDVSGGSSNFPVVRAALEKALAILESRMATCMPAKNGHSILECLFAGNYAPFQRQRRYLQDLGVGKRSSAGPQGHA